MNLPEIKIEELLESGVHFGIMFEGGTQKWRNTFMVLEIIFTYLT